MTHESAATPSDRFVGRLIAFYVVQFVVIGIQMPFFPVWLADRGFDARTIGFVLSAPLIVRVAVMPIALRLADRFGAVRGALVTVAAVAALSYALAGVSNGAVPILMLVVVALMSFSMTFPLADAYALRGLALRRHPYGRVRMWGSVAFLVANILGGYVFALIAPGHLIWLIVAAAAATAIAAFNLVPRAVEHVPQAGAPEAHARIWRMPAFVVAVAASSMIQASHAVFYGFSAIDWTARGLSGTAIGSLWALAVMSEIVLFAFAARLPAAVGPVQLILIGAVGAVVRWSAMATEPSLILLPFLQCLHAFSFGATHLGASMLITRIAPARMAATAQGDMSTVHGVMMAISTGLAGVLFEAYGSLAYVGTACFAAAGGLAALWLVWNSRRQQP